MPKLKPPAAGDGAAGAPVEAAFADAALPLAPPKLKPPDPPLEFAVAEPKRPPPPDGADGFAPPKRVVGGAPAGVVLPAGAAPPAGVPVAEAGLDPKLNPPVVPGAAPVLAPPSVLPVPPKENPPLEGAGALGGPGAAGLLPKLKTPPPGAGEDVPPLPNDPPVEPPAGAPPPPNKLPVPEPAALLAPPKRLPGALGVPLNRKECEMFVISLTHGCGCASTTHLFHQRLKLVVCRSQKQACLVVVLFTERITFSSARTRKVRSIPCKLVSLTALTGPSSTKGEPSKSTIGSY